VIKESETIIRQLQQDTESLLAELADASSRNDELNAARESDAITIRDLENQVREWKKKYESAKTELRSIKGVLAKI
jgi:protein SPA2